MEKGMDTGEKLEMIGRKILTVSRNELYLKMRFLDVALSSLAFVMDVGADGLGTDGLFLYYHPQYLGGLYREDRIRVNRLYLHLVLHGIFHQKEGAQGTSLQPCLRYCRGIHHRRHAVPVRPCGPFFAPAGNLWKASQGTQGFIGG